MLQPRPTTAEHLSAQTPAGRAVALLIELADIGRAIELQPEPWTWPLAQRTFRARTDLRNLIAELTR